MCILLHVFTREGLKKFFTYVNSCLVDFARCTGVVERFLGVNPVDRTFISSVLSGLCPVIYILPISPCVCVGGGGGVCVCLNW